MTEPGNEAKDGKIHLKRERGQVLTTTDRTIDKAPSWGYKNAYLLEEIKDENLEETNMKFCGYF